ncbi:TetR/AcrR family transcriptional regulator [Paenibacillus tianjinensis]|uniref:TetR/AcrR family transcriptional regulator n=1 Tax=Paenibacillus tianjinensis TaxID=2810347 RepID=A0ABX7LDR8_9BACL|nr:TetR/AcrR family transcriptional regulator [Paenibacillus tianjinensis]QSF45391.1 TetR/AcrR family transcriptional regulator [Paenibacillus tianjinensis]
MDWKRARSTEQIESRKQEILDAAYRLFEETEYDHITLNGIARELQISKPSIYRYFSSREEIFLDIYGQEYERFTKELIGELMQLSTDPLPTEVSFIWVKVYQNHPKLLKLMPYLGVALERNSSEPSLKSFKATNIDLQEQLAKQLTVLYPTLTIQDGFYIQYYVFLIASSLWTLSNPTEPMQQILRGYQHLNIDYSFNHVLSQGIEVHINNFIQKKQ